MSSLKAHHKRGDVAVNRPSYREARWDRAVKVYTVNQESKYLLVQNVHALGVTEELMQLFSLYGSIEEYRLLDEYPSEPYTDVYWIKFTSIDAARVAKKKTDDHSFFGKNLHVCYAPEYETVDDTREKLQQRRKVIASKTRDKSSIPEKTGTRSVQTSSSCASSSSSIAQGEPSHTQASIQNSESTQLLVPSSVLAPTTPQSSSTPGTGLLPLPTILPAPPHATSAVEQSYPSMNNPPPISPLMPGGAGGSSQPMAGTGHGLSQEERVSLYLSSLDDPVLTDSRSKASAQKQTCVPTKHTQKADNPVVGSHDCVGVSHDLSTSGSNQNTSIKRNVQQFASGTGGPVVKKRRKRI